MPHWKITLAVSAVGLALLFTQTAEGGVVTEEGLIFRQILRQPDKTYVVELCSLPPVPGHVNREYDFTGVYPPEVSDAEILGLRNGTCHRQVENNE